jgi:NADH dehydrogenase
VQVKTGLMVKNIDREGLTIQSRDCIDRLEARTVIWAGGVTVSELGKTLAKRTNAETDKGGRIKAGPQLTVAGYSDIYVVGDLALSLDSNGKPLRFGSGGYARRNLRRKGHHPEGTR